MANISYTLGPIDYLPAVSIATVIYIARLKLNQLSIKCDTQLAESNHVATIT